MTGGTALGEAQRYRGSLLGLACGDAVGTTVEFCPRGSFAPLTDMQGGGPFALPAGAWTDDCSMALCLAHSLVHCRGFNAVDQMNRYCNWASLAYMSSTGECFDIGGTVSSALQRYRNTGQAFAGSTDPATAGNGCLMRLAPLPMFYFNQPEQLPDLAIDCARTTHAAAEALDCTRLFALQLRAALAGESKDSICAAIPFQPATTAGQMLKAGDWRQKNISQIRGSGYVVESLEAALWCFWFSNDFESAVLAAANLGDDADTTAAIVGQLAGAHYGVDAIPGRWLSMLCMREEIQHLADELLRLRP